MLYYPYASADIDALYLRAAAGLFGNSITSSSEDEDWALCFYFYLTISLPFLSNHAIDQSISILSISLPHSLAFMLKGLPLVSIKEKLHFLMHIDVAYLPINSFIG